ncbi:MAG: ATP-binding cassette domain-containing protein [Bacteroidales bacterium]|nr:ATP-binding cassette domain-containing protein [Bacteroidales bacterium]
MSIIVQNITYLHPDRENLFHNISFTVQERDKIALIGNNGSGKSTLLKIIAGILTPAQGTVKVSSEPYYIPQHFGQFDEMTVAEALRVDKKLEAFYHILDGNVSDESLSVLNDDWSIEERCYAALSEWGLKDISFTQKMKDLSGGEKTKVFLSGTNIHQPEIILLDEPTNHLDTSSRDSLYRWMESTPCTMMVVSHDRTLLNLLHPIYELEKEEIVIYGGNYEFYKARKEEQLNALLNQVNEKEKQLRLAKKTAREALERKEKQNVRGQKRKEKENALPALMDKLKGKAEKSTAKLKGIHTHKIEGIGDELKQVQQKLPSNRIMKMDFEDASLHSGKILVTAQDINFAYGPHPLWHEALNFQIKSGERIHIEGKNGSGKTTLIKIILGELQPTSGTLKRSKFNAVYIDQDYSLVQNHLTVYEQGQLYNRDALPEHEVKTRLNRYLFNKDFWNKPCNVLSGGEKMRLVLCCLMISNHAPDLFILDEPTNNLDIQNIEILRSAINEYSGTVLVVSHDKYFLEEIGVDRNIQLN